jgi:hypothetical protein
MATSRTGRQPAKVVAIGPDGEDQETDSSTAPDTSGWTDEELIKWARKRLMEAIPEAAKALATGASSGSVPHIKLLLELVGLDEGELGPETECRREKTLEEIVMEQWRKEP